MPDYGLEAVLGVLEPSRTERGLGPAQLELGEEFVGREETLKPVLLLSGWIDHDDCRRPLDGVTVANPLPSSACCRT